MLNKEGRGGWEDRITKYIRRVGWITGDDRGQQQGPDARNKKQYQTNTLVKTAARERIGGGHGELMGERQRGHNVVRSAVDHTWVVSGLFLTSRSRARFSSSGLSTVSPVEKIVGGRRAVNAILNTGSLA